MFDAVSSGSSESSDQEIDDDGYMPGRNGDHEENSDDDHDGIF